MDAKKIALNYLEETCELNRCAQDLIDWMGEDDFIRWFFHSYFANDEAELKKTLGEDNAQVIIDYYDDHLQ